MRGSTSSGVRGYHFIVFGLIVATLLNFFSQQPPFDSTTTMSLTSAGSGSHEDLIVVAPTFYRDQKDPRFTLGLECCQAAARHKIRLIIVDASPEESIRDQLRQHGAPYVQVFAQTASGKKGAALRQAIRYAYDALKDKEKGVIAFQEPEKIDMIHQWPALASYMMNAKADICVPRRSDESFKRTYPIEQYHSENFANLHLDAVAARVGFHPSIDWTMGPIAFRQKLAPIWLDYGGHLWDAQIVPMVRAQRQNNAIVASFDVEFQHPPSMKQQEEGVPEWSNKRLFQLNNLFEVVGKELS